MEGYVISLCNNDLKVSAWDGESFLAGTAQLDKDACDDTKVLDSKIFARNLGELFVKTFGKTPLKLPLHFLVEPQDVCLGFVSVGKDADDPQSYILHLISEELLKKDWVLDDVYFSSKKIAPFTYQFIAVQKEYLEKFIAVSAILGLELKAVVPWVLMLPKIVSPKGCAVFVYDKGESKTVVLSELGGISDVSIHKKEQDLGDLEKEAAKKAVYQKECSQIYSLDQEDFSLGSESSFNPIPLPQVKANLKGYETHWLYISTVAKDPDCLSNHLNLLNTMPVPEKAKVHSMVYVGVFVGLILAGLTVFAGVNLLKDKMLNSSEQFAQNPDSAPVVLSEKEYVSEQEEQKQEETKPEKNLAKKDFGIRVENGSGVSGAAGRMRDFLEERGYSVSDIGDAESFDREDTLVHFKTGFLQYKDMLLNDLKDDYKVEVKDGLDDDLEYAVLIVVGKK